MCGIFGFSARGITEQQLISATDKLVKRGPDDSGYFFNSPIGLGHRRLSIIDLSTGDQPMFNKDKSIIIVFNGEIYNFKNIREELELQGIQFTTKSDTEVIIEAYGAWGIEKCLEKLEGMFAFAIWDEKLQKLLVARDRFGEKPLYYTRNERGFFFASELKALLSFHDSKNLSKTALNLYLSLTYIPAPYTIYKDLFKVEAGCYLTVDLDGNFKSKQYYDFKSISYNNQQNQLQNYKDAKKELRIKLFDSVQERMISDVPLGSFLSGGIDSSVVTAIMAKLSSQPIKTFSIGFKEKEYDESERATLVAKHIGSDHTLFVVGHEDLLEIVDETLAYFDEPFGDSSVIPSMMVAKKAKEKVTVVLTGDCADELFGGYDKYLGKHYADQYNRYPKMMRAAFEKLIGIIPHTSKTNQILRKVKKVIHSAGLNPEQRYASLSSLGYNELQKNELLKPEFQENSIKVILKHFIGINGDELSKTFYSDVKLVLEGDMLTKVDRACMLNSLEARVPFLDSKIAEFSTKLPHHFKIEGTNKKKILKDTFSDLVPEETMSFSKKGFGIPIRLWFQNELKEKLEAQFKKTFIEEQGLFKYEAIQQLLTEHFNNKENHSAKLWLLFVFQKWYINHN
ncbi:asparagine synthase (glutamine-hydrolyzing) [Flavobacterium sp. KS-LB2]|uniref:asparagine synthase (glutamine-hydrolyzing) n=1 Tax=Flavobacterium sp. KS-LB2 TaxID=3120525 RepID=UPI0030CBCB37